MLIISGVEHDVLAVWLEDGWALALQVLMGPYQLYRACTQMHVTSGSI